MVGRAAASALSSSAQRDLSWLQPRTARSQRLCPFGPAELRCMCAHWPMWLPLDLCAACDVLASRQNRGRTQLRVPTASGQRAGFVLGGPVRPAHVGGGRAAASAASRPACVPELALPVCRWATPTAARCAGSARPHLHQGWARSPWSVLYRSHSGAVQYWRCRWGM